LTLRIFLVAGEASGDLLGASLMRALKELHPGVEFRGIGGAAMQGEGLSSLFPMQELSIMGIFEVAPKLVGILKRMRQTVNAVLDFGPHALVTIDAPDFSLRVARKVRAKGAGVKLIHYVAPSVWAWRPGRAKKIAAFLDHLLTLLPFEPPYFAPHGLSATFVGHPIVEKAGSRGDGDRFRKKYGLAPMQNVLCLLPGSRVSELDRLLERFSEAAGIVLRRHPEAAVVIPTLPHLKPRLEAFFTGRGINPIITDDAGEKFDCFAASTAALAASGTVTLELALCDTPHVIGYRLGAVSAWLAKKIIRTPYVNLVNIILKRAAVPELLLEHCEPKALAGAVLKLMDEREPRARQLTDFREALIALGLGDPETPGARAARAVLQQAGFPLQ
jgi:lipid-A-disaccharide synthase